MPARGNRGPVHERRIEDFVQDDPEDSDFEDAAVPRSSKKRRPISRVKGKSSKRQRRARRSYDADDVVDDSEDMESEESFSEEEEPELIERDPITGRPKRKAVKQNTANYAESEGSELPDEEDGDDVEDSEDELATSPMAKKTRRRMLVKLSLPSKKLARFEDKPPATRRRATRSNSIRAVSEARITRASARISEEPEELFELTTSGRARPVAAKGLPRTGGKGLKAPLPDQPSMILEESQEDSAAPVAEEEKEDDVQDPMVESIEETNLENSQEDPEAAAESEEDSDDEGPIFRRRSTRAVSFYVSIMLHRKLTFMFRPPNQRPKLAPNLAHKRTREAEAKTIMILSKRQSTPNQGVPKQRLPRGQSEREVLLTQIILKRTPKQVMISMMTSS
jgi:hypothetical protein